MLLKGVTFENWLRTHKQKHAEERWLRELYPWPVLAQVDCDQAKIGQPQLLQYDTVEYQVTLKSVQFQSSHGTYRYRLLVESEGLGWHARAYDDNFDMCATAAGEFVTVFNTERHETLERITKNFFERNWKALHPNAFRCLAVSRFLAATLVSESVCLQYPRLEHYPTGRVYGGGRSPLLADEDKFWVVYSFSSERAFKWARGAALRARETLALYFTDTLYQINTDVPSSARVMSITQFDAERNEGRYSDLIRVLQRGLEIPSVQDLATLERTVRGQERPPDSELTEDDVREALAALKTECRNKDQMRYQMAAGVVLNAWIESERRLGFPQRKRFYAFKRKIDSLVRWALEVGLNGVEIWSEYTAPQEGPVLYVRIDEVDFSFHAIPLASELARAGPSERTWTGVRLKPIAHLVLAWARALL